ncbi:hypothetical protein E2C01_067273 [Portunus trituberculatus]|uniref:Uncharacterized protein n=1 Tax=Portunus trituberculatus TaxID=210409 RepID=A0A5B7HUK7_PORTR|nr:hypothetical protein [Portunus trituberculatus]
MYQQRRVKEKVKTDQDNPEEKQAKKRAAAGSEEQPAKNLRSELVCRPDEDEQQTDEEQHRHLICCLDEVPSRAVKYCVEQLAPVLTQLLQDYIAQGQVSKT